MSEVMPYSGSPVRLYSLLTEYPNTKALRSGTIPSALIELDRHEVKVIFENFKPLVRELKYDVAELPIVTYLQARQYGKKLVLLPFVMNGRFQHDCLVHNAERGPLDITKFAGKRIGVRSYTQTTVAWVRGILQDGYGLDPADATWVTIEDSHLAEYRDPPHCERAPAGKKLPQMLIDGEIDAAVLAPAMYNDARIKPLIPDAREAALAWFNKTQIRPMNHMVVVKQQLSHERPDVVREIYRVLVESKKAAPAPANGIDLTPAGVEANRRSLEAICDYAYRSKVTDRRLSVDELFDDVTRALVA
jgi:4,5-dihydroxyphthalate decarboxylase